MIIKFSRLVSIVAHPVFIPIIAIMALTHLHYMIVAKLVPETKWIFIAAYTLSLTIVPLLGTSLMLKKYNLRDLSNLTNGERTHAALALAVVYFFIAYTFQSLFVDKILQVFVVALGVSALALSIITRYIRISFHTFGWAGLLALMLVIEPNATRDINFTIALTFVASALVATARLVLKAHNHKEVYLGFVCGFICNIAVYSFYYGL